MQKIALLSIKPKFANQILFGIKKYEYRKTSISHQTTHILLYMTAPVKRIVGIATIKKVHSGAPSRIWEKTKTQAGVVRSFYRIYFKGVKTAYAIELDRVTPFNQWIDPKQLDKNFRAPQSFKYVDKSFTHKLLEMGDYASPNMGSNILFFAGIHGAGKTTMGNKLQKEIDIAMFSASQLIKEGKGKLNTNKKVNDIEDNQRILLEQLKVKSTLGLFMLDGHFSLIDKNGAIQEIPLDVFKQINPREIILLEANAKTIHDRLYTRDQIRHSINVIQNMLEKERSHALSVAKELKIPIKIITKDEYYLLKEHIKRFI